MKNNGEYTVKKDDEAYLDWTNQALMTSGEKEKKVGFFEWRKKVVNKAHMVQVMVPRTQVHDGSLIKDLKKQRLW